MNQFRITDLTMIEKAIILRNLSESGHLRIVDAESKRVWPLADVSKQGDIIQITVSKR